MGGAIPFLVFFHFLKKHEDVGKTIRGRNVFVCVVIVSQPPPPPSHDSSIISEADKFCCNQLFLRPPVNGFSSGGSKSAASLGKGGLGSELQTCMVF